MTGCDDRGYEAMTGWDDRGCEAMTGHTTTYARAWPETHSMNTHDCEAGHTPSQNHSVQPHTCTTAPTYTAIATHLAPT